MLTARAAFRVGLDANAGHYEPLLEGGSGVSESIEIKDIYKWAWKEFIPPAVVGVATVTCIIAANRVGTRRASALAAAFNISEKLAEEYKSKVVDSIGKKAEENIRTKIAKDKIDASPGRMTLIIEGSNALFYDSFSGRLFVSDMEKVRKAVNDINFQVNNSFYASLTDFYDLIGLDRTAMSDEFGWNADEQLDITFTGVLTEDNRPAISMDFNKTPIRGYDRVQ